MTRKHQMEEEPSFKSIFESDTELSQYKPNHLAVFALSLDLRLDDVHEFAANAITDGPDDKKVDLCYLDMNSSRAIIAQSHFSTTWGKAAAPKNKASDLNTAVAWLLSSNEDQIPPHLKPKATDLRQALKDGDISEIEILYIHNCNESPDVESELGVVATYANGYARSFVSSDTEVKISAREIGLRGIEEIYKSRNSEILVDEWLDVPVSPNEYVEEEGEEWKAILATVPGKWIQELYNLHRQRLFSANYREYLGSSKRKGDINKAISDTAKNEPSNFWVYNNGITALTNELELQPSIRIRGISVINGAQTTGALSSAEESSDENARVLIRIVECTKRDVIDKIIQYNNTQNAIRAFDRRSNDPIQIRLQRGFESYGIPYIHRRGPTQTPRGAIKAASIAPALCAFHGDLQNAYRNAPAIFLDQEIYDNVFRSTVSQEHIFLVRTLSKAIDDAKTDLKSKTSNNTATQQQERQYDALKWSASRYLMLYIMGSLSEEIKGQKVVDSYRWICIPDVIKIDNESMVKAWDEALRAILPHVARRMEDRGPNAFYEIPRSAELSKQISSELRADIASLEPSLRTQFDNVRQRTVIR